MAQLNRNVNVVSGLELKDGTTVIVHSMPISRETFERHYMVMAKAMSVIFTEHLQLFGARIAGLVLKNIAVDLGVWDGVNGVERTLVAEIRRLSNVLMPQEGGGYNPVPLDQLIVNGSIEGESLAELMNALVFFTLVSRVVTRDMRDTLLEGMSRLWATSPTPWTLMEYINSLRTSSETGSIGPKEDL